MAVYKGQIQWVLICDHPGCDKIITHVAYQQIQAIQHAKNMGWTVSETGSTTNCPQHAREIPQTAQYRRIENVRGRQ